MAYASCQACGRIFPVDQLVPVPFVDAESKPYQAWLCPVCRNPYVTYIQGLRFQSVDVVETLQVALTLTLTTICVAFGVALHTTASAFLAIAGIVIGAASFAVLAVKRATT